MNSIEWTPLDYEEGQRCNLPAGESLAILSTDPDIIRHVYKISDDFVELRSGGGEVPMDKISHFAPFNLPG
jgi:hypothetical protein